MNLTPVLTCEHCQEEDVSAYKYGGELYCDTCNFNLGVEDDDPILNEYEETILASSGPLSFRGTEDEARAFTKGVGITTDIFGPLVDLALRVREEINT